MSASESKRVLALLGASGHGKVVADAALAAGWDDVVFFDDRWPALTMNAHWLVAGDTSMLLGRAFPFDAAIVSIGNCRIRLDKQLKLQEAGIPMATVIHPHAWVSPHARLGVGTVVMAGAVVNVDAHIGDAGIVNTGASVDHDCVLAPGVHVSPGARLSGDVKVGIRSWIGVGAALRQGITVGDDAMVGAGAVVVKPVANGMTVVGNPAAPLSRTPELVPDTRTLIRRAG
jgi:sugar O-acyltransferase (sialic acid O-acetyltransferase NeuD family)